MFASLLPNDDSVPRGEPGLFSIRGRRGREVDETPVGSGVDDLRPPKMVEHRDGPLLVVREVLSGGRQLLDVETELIDVHEPPTYRVRL